MTQLQGLCSICDADITSDSGVEESEILICPECKSRLVVSSIRDNHLMLEQAPEVEEDWGE
jgi:lysine biosynthesis protein LysW